MATTTEIESIVLRERRMAISEREWKHRLRGYGYDISDTAEGPMVTSLVNNRPLFTLSRAVA